PGAFEILAVDPAPVERPDMRRHVVDVPVCAEDGLLAAIGALRTLVTERDEMVGVELADQRRGGVDPFVVVGQGSGDSFLGPAGTLLVAMLQGHDRRVLCIAYAGDAVHPGDDGAYIIVRALRGVFVRIELAYRVGDRWPRVRRIVHVHPLAR